MTDAKAKKKSVTVPAKNGPPRVVAAMKRTNAVARKNARERNGAASAAKAGKAQHAITEESAPVQKLHLSKDQKQKYTDLLTKLHEKISKQISFLATDSLNKSDADEPRDDVTDDFDRDFALSLLTSEHDVLFEINQAMKRVQEGTYGRCEQCSSAVGMARLNAIPFARLCISCQSTAERDKSHYQPFGSTIADASKAAAGQTSGNPEE